MIRIIKTIVAGIFFLIAATLGAAEGKRPNVLFVFADDWGRFAGAYAKADGRGTPNDLLKTPVIDGFAREGVLFRKAFVSAPSCTPCRSSLLSGKHFWQTGRAAILLGAVWDGSNPSFPLLLRDDGYHIGESYKVWGPGSPNDAPFASPKHSYEKAGREYNEFSQNVTKMAAQGKSIEEAKRVLYKEVQNNFDAFLADRKPGQPFLYWFGPWQVHRVWVKGSGKKLWGIDPEKLKGKLPPFLPDVPEIREDFADYLGEIQALDAGIGILRKRLQEIGELENTIIVISGDHGPPGFPYGKCNLYDFGSSVPLIVSGPGARGGRVVDDLVNIQDLAPTLLELCGAKVPEVMSARSLKNILQSEKKGVVEPARDAVFMGRERHVANARADSMPYPQRAIRTHEYLYIINFRPDRYPLGDPYGLQGSRPPTAEQITTNTFVTLPDEDAGPAKAWLVTHRNDPQWKPYFDRAYGKRPREELYDLKKDPHQMKNVASDARYQSVKAGLEKRLLEELKRTNDPRLVEDGKFFETPPMSNPVGPAPPKE